MPNRGGEEASTQDIPDSERATRPGAAEERDEELYDAYLDAALTGPVQVPSDFLASHPDAGETLRARLECLHRMLLKDQRTPVAAPAAESGLPFAQLGEFRLIRALDEGGMGTVYLAEQVSLGRIVALKVVRPELQASPSAAARFDREAEAVARLRHPHIVTGIAAGQDQGVRYFAMEFVPGRGLDEVLQSAADAGEPLSTARVVQWGAAIARALACAHAAGIVHRDVKPANIRITPEGRPLLIDFGIARDLSVDGLTRTGPLLGSPAYAAPEQIRGSADGIDARTDVYGLGVTLYECLTGRAPFHGKTVEQTLHRALFEDAQPARRLNPAISRDLEVVVGTAMNKSPAARYPSAEALADDLDALLEFRPIEARAPSWPRRLWKWARRNPASAAALAVVLVGALGFVAFLALQQRRDRERRERDALAAVERAHGLIREYREKRTSIGALERRVDELQEKLATSYLRPEDDRVLDEHESAVESAREAREALFYEVLDVLRRAEELDPDVVGTDPARAELYLEKWRESIANSNAGAASFYSRLVSAYDAEGEHTRWFRGQGTVRIESDPPGAHVHLFRYREQSEVVDGGDHRLVPVPVQESAPVVQPGAWVLRVEGGRDIVAPDDLVVSLDGRTVREIPPGEARALARRGGAEAVVARAGRLATVTLPRGLQAWVSSQPLPLSSACRVGTTPLARGQLEIGSYVAVLTHPGHESQRVWFRVTRDYEPVCNVRLRPAGTTPSGFVFVPRDHPDVPHDFWIMRRELTLREYLEYLEDPSTRREVDASPRRIRVPRESYAGRDYVVRDDEGRLRIPDDWSLDWPVLGISHEDAQAYATWRNQRRGPDLARYEYALPSFGEWTAAATRSTSDSRFYVFGSRFRPKWVKSCYARPQANPEPVLSYPIDESITGAFDMSGSAFEWCDDWYDEARGLRRVNGGSWGRATPDVFKVQGGVGFAPDFANGETGMRLVLRPLHSRDEGGR